MSTTLRLLPNPRGVQILKYSERHMGPVIETHFAEDDYERERRRYARDPDLEAHRRFTEVGVRLVESRPATSPPKPKPALPKTAVPITQAEFDRLMSAYRRRIATARNEADVQEANALADDAARIAITWSEYSRTLAESCRRECQRTGKSWDQVAPEFGLDGGISSTDPERRKVERVQQYARAHRCDWATACAATGLFQR